MACLFSRQEMSILAHGKMAISMVKVATCGRTGRAMKALLPMILWKEKAYTISLTEESMKALLLVA